MYVDRPDLVFACVCLGEIPNNSANAAMITA
jgi:hypothetical protein